MRILRNRKAPHTIRRTVSKSAQNGDKCTLLRKFAMLLSNQINRFAHQLLNARARRRLIAPISSAQALSANEAYEIAKRIHDIRIAEGEVTVGRKIGFVNQTIWPKGAHIPLVHAPIWTTLFDRSIIYAENDAATLSLKNLLQPRIGPEIVFQLREAPRADCTMYELADCIEWMAHGIEITTCPFPQWQFSTADAIIAFGLHGALIIGEPRTVSSISKQHLSTMMVGVSVSLSCDEVLRTAGFGSDILNSPLHALWHLHQMLTHQTLFPPLQAGEIITTGSWTEALDVAPGQLWQTAFGGIAMDGLVLSLT